MMRARAVTILAFVAGLILQNCYYDNEQELYGETVCAAAEPTFTRVSEIIRQRCLSCHSAGAAQGGIVLEGYDKVRSLATAGRLKGAVTHASGFSPMPKNAPQLGKCDLDAIVQWIDAGALNN